MSKVIPISSTGHFKQTTASSTYTVVDFYAGWCGPCKVISPVFEQLANQESKPGRIVFAKVNVDSQRDVAAIYGISAMPTFLILKGTKVTETIRGANPTALRSAILSAAADAAKGPAKAAASFSGSGQKLGAENATAGSGRTVGGGDGGGGGGRGGGAGMQLPAIPDVGQMFSAPAAFAQGRSIPAMIVRFLGLYISTLFSFDAVKAAEESGYAVKKSNVKTR